MAETQLRLWSDDDGFAGAAPPGDMPPAGYRKSTEVIGATQTAAQCTTPAVTEPPCDEAIPRLLTSGVIAEETGASLARVRHILRSRPDIRIAAYAGLTRLFRRETVARVRHELNAIDARRSNSDGGNQWKR